MAPPKRKLIRRTQLIDNTTPTDAVQSNTVSIPSNPNSFQEKQRQYYRLTHQSSAPDVLVDAAIAQENYDRVHRSPQERVVVGTDPYAGQDRDALRTAGVIYTPEDIEQTKQLAEAHNASFFGGMVAPPISPEQAEKNPAYVRWVIAQDAKFLPQNILMGFSTPGIISGASWSVPAIRAANIGLAGNMTFQGVNDMVQNGANLSNLFQTGLGALVLGSESNIVNAINNHPNLVAFLRHPTYKKYYHGSPYDFDLSKAYMGTINDLGLHASGSRKAVKWATDGSKTGVIKEFWAPRPSMETIDLGNNGKSHLMDKIDLQVDGTHSGWDKYRVKLIKKYYPFKVNVTYDTKPKYTYINSGSWKNRVVIPLRDEIWPNMPANARKEADLLIKEFDKKQLDKNLKRHMYMPDINRRAAGIFSKYGKKVIKYHNENPWEGGGVTSYMITDPSVIYEHTPFRVSRLPAFPFYSYSILKNENEKD